MNNSKDVVNNRSKNSANEGIRIVSTAAFCFAIVSWVATAQGLKDYVFNGNGWQAYIVSFAIQAILFVFNLKLPLYLHKIGEISRDRRKNYRKSKEGKFEPIQALIVIFYSIILLASSFFSFVYISRYTYNGTKYIDANTVLDNEYRNYISEVDDYAAEYLKLSRILLGDRLSELLFVLPDDMSNDVTREMLEEEYYNANAEYTLRQYETEAKKESVDAAYDWYTTPAKDRWRSDSDFQNERVEYEAAREELTEAIQNEQAAKTILDHAKSALDNYIPSTSSVVNVILSELLNPDITSDGIKKLKDLMGDLYNSVLLMEDDVNDYSSIVYRTQLLEVTLDDYIMLQEVLGNGDTSDVSLETIKEDLQSTLISVPKFNSSGYDGEECEEWKNSWNERIVALEMILKNLPTFSEDYTENLDDVDNVVDVELLSSFADLEIVDSVSNLARRYISGVNPIEEACQLLRSEYSTLAWFSALFALFLDVSSLLAGVFVYYIKEIKCHN